MGAPLLGTDLPRLLIEDRRVLLSALASESERLLRCLAPGEFPTTSRAERARLLGLLRATHAEFKRLVHY